MTQRAGCVIGELIEILLTFLFRRVLFKGGFLPR